MNPFYAIFLLACFLGGFTITAKHFIGEEELPDELIWFGGILIGGALFGALLTFMQSV